jgi:glycosyltransferase involved in cell wall biosynthesis
MVNLANQLGPDAVLAAIRPSGRLSSEIKPSVRVVSLYGRLLWPLALLYQAWKLRPAAIISSAWDVNFCVMMSRALLPPETRVIVREAADPGIVANRRAWTRVLSPLYFRLYRNARFIVVLSRNMARRVGRRAGQSRERIRIIHNAPSVDRLPDLARQPHRTQHDLPHFVSLGRLDHQKGFDVLIAAFAQLLRAGPHARLTIYGEGAERAALEELVQQLDVQEAVRLPGAVSNLDVLLGADFFVLSSRFEGLSNAMLEALAMGVPVVAVTRGTGAEEFVLDGQNGYQVRRCEVQSLKEGLEKALAHRGNFDRARIAREAREMLSFERHFEAYCSLFKSTDQKVDTTREGA